MQVNMTYVDDILGFMIEGQYLDEQVPEAYVEYIEEYMSSMDEMADKDRVRVLDGLRASLKYVLNQPGLDCDQLFFEGAMHGWDDPRDARKVFELIWQMFFKSENWLDEQYAADGLAIVREPIW